MSDPRNASEAAVVDLAALARVDAGPRLAWSYQGEELNANLLVFAAGDGVDEHVNDEVEVLLVGIAGEGSVAVEGRNQVLRAGQALVVPRGARRGIHAISDRFTYLTCHRRRSGLRPVTTDRHETRRPAPDAQQSQQHR